MLAAGLRTSWPLPASLALVQLPPILPLMPLVVRQLLHLPTLGSPPPQPLTLHLLLRQPPH